MYWMLIGNTRSYGGLIDVMHRAEANDGLFDAAVMRRGGAWHLLIDGARLLLKRHDRSPNIDYARAKVLEIDTPGLPVQLDGEYAGVTPMRFEVMPLALTVIVPRGLRSPLLGNEA
jgi:diacylglycerol kinase family enzyme